MLLSYNRCECVSSRSGHKGSQGSRGQLGVAGAAGVIGFAGNVTFFTHLGNGVGWIGKAPCISKLV